MSVKVDLAFYELLSSIRYREDFRDVGIETVDGKDVWIQDWARAKYDELTQLTLLRDLLGIEHTGPLASKPDDMPVEQWFKSRYVLWSIDKMMWWRWNKLGYTKHLHEAGLYREDDAFMAVSRESTNTIRIPIENLLGPERGSLPEDVG